MQKILKNEDLITGEWYWCIGKELYHDFSIYEVISPNEDSKYLAERIWAMDNNSQALEKWDIYGPIPRPCKIGPIPKPYLEVQIIDMKQDKFFWTSKEDIGKIRLFYRFTGKTSDDGYLLVEEYLWEKYYQTISFPNPSQIVYTKDEK